MHTLGIVGAFLCIIACGCGGSTPPPSDPSTEATASTPSAASESASKNRDTTAAETTPNEGAEAKAPASATSPPERPVVQFPPKAGVNEAISAVPQGLPRMNMSDDALRAPLTNMKQYEVCKVPRSTKVSISVAVYDGAAVGVDLSTKPKNAKIEACVDDLVRKLSWTKVPSLNTVMFNF